MKSAKLFAPKVGIRSVTKGIKSYEHNSSGAPTTTMNLFENLVPYQVEIGDFAPWTTGIIRSRDECAEAEPG